MNRSSAYWHGVGLSLDGENRKATAYITHNGSLGVAREQIFRRTLLECTPPQYRAKTGQVRDDLKGPKGSRQCDILVYEGLPKYEIGDYVVVSRNVAKCVIEVKSKITRDHFRDFLRIHDSLLSYDVKSYCFAFNSYKYDTLVDMFCDEFLKNRLRVGTNQQFLNWPYMLAVQSRNYLFVRPTISLTTDPHKYYMCCFDFSTGGKDLLGHSTACFLEIYNEVLRNSWYSDRDLFTFYNKVAITSKCWIDYSGKKQTIAIP